MLRQQPHPSGPPYERPRRAARAGGPYQRGPGGSWLGSETCAMRAWVLLAVSGILWLYVFASRAHSYTSRFRPLSANSIEVSDSHLGSGDSGPDLQAKSAAIEQEQAEVYHRLGIAQTAQLDGNSAQAHTQSSRLQELQRLQSQLEELTAKVAQEYGGEGKTEPGKPSYGALQATHTLSDSLSVSYGTDPAEQGAVLHEHEQEESRVLQEQERKEQEREEQERKEQERKEQERAAQEQAEKEAKEAGHREQAERAHMEQGVQEVVTTNAADPVGAGHAVTTASGAFDPSRIRLVVTTYRREELFAWERSSRYIKLSKEGCKEPTFCKQPWVNDPRLARIPTTVYWNKPNAYNRLRPKSIEQPIAPLRDNMQVKEVESSALMVETNSAGQQMYRLSKECPAFLQYIIDNYEDLPDVSVFLQGWATRGRAGPLAARPVPDSRGPQCSRSGVVQGTPSTTRRTSLATWRAWAGASTPWASTTSTTCTRTVSYTTRKGSAPTGMS